MLLESGSPLTDNGSNSILLTFCVCGNKDSKISRVYHMMWRVHNLYL